ncbi:MAG TPA: methyltransferase domain-containing protein [Candidatus Saccharimonadales bacterium]|jgi:ubiquinone/menaquinone biosynthesis C-methylase UbiE|nr:methyltransferase domain-containing protein [Candidatus Saccharimonadales bacterium]
MGNGSGDVGRVGCPSAVRPADDVELRGLRAEGYFRGKDVLDIGTGDGRLVWLIAPMARSVTGLDPDPEGIREAARNAKRRRVRNARFKVSIAQDLGVGSERFDTAVFSWSL